MNFKKYYNPTLITEDNESHDYSCTMAMVESNQIKPFKEFLKKINTKDLAENGKEPESHCTILYGTHTDDIEEIKKTLAKTGITEIKMKLEGLSTFPPNDDNEIVLKVGVESKELNALNKILTKLPHTNDFPTYKPHITVAYLKPKAQEKYLKMKDPFEGVTLTTSVIMFATSKGVKTKFNLSSLKQESFKQFVEDMTAGSGGAFGTYTSGSYAAGDARIPKVLGPLQQRPAFMKRRRKKRRKRRY